MTLGSKTTTPALLAGEDGQKGKTRPGVFPGIYLSCALPVHFGGEDVTIWGRETGLSVTLTQSLSSVPLTSFLPALSLSFPGDSNNAHFRVGIKNV